MAAPMAESVQGIPPAATIDRPDGLLSTKLHVPASRPGFVVRSRLVAQLDAGLARTLTLTCAPAGFGKTALLADWGHRSSRSLAWVALDNGDNDPVRFWRHIVAALDPVRPGIAERIGPMLGPPAPFSFDGLVGALINELESQPAEDQAVLVLDDYHLIESPAVHGSLTFLLEHLPSRVHLVLSTRADPPLPLARLRAAGELVELRAADLRFTSEEAASLLRSVLGPGLPLTNESLAALDARTEGWAAGLQLVALSLRGQSDVEGFIASFSGSHRYVLDYLTEEVLERQSSDLRSFLLETSVLERLSGELCDALTGRADGQAMLEEIERANLFLVPLDDERAWWRYHHLFADLLRVRVGRERPDRLQELHRSAAGWYEQHGFAEDAVHHAAAARDTGWAARIVEHNAEALIQRSREGTLRRWLTALPAEVVASRPRLLWARSMAALFAGDLRAVEGALDAAERAFAGGADEFLEPSAGTSASSSADMPATIALVRANLAEFRGDAEEALMFGHQAVAHFGKGEHLLGESSRLSLGRAERLSGRLDDAERTFTRIIDQPQATAPTSLVVWAFHYLGQVRQAQGDLSGAADVYRRAHTFTPTSGKLALPTAAVAYLGLAEVAYQRGDLADALDHSTQAIALCREIANAMLMALGLTTLAWIRQAQGDPAGAQETMSQAMDVELGPEVVDLVNPVPARRARLLLAQGDIEAAAAWTATRELSATDEPGYPWEPAYLILARVLRAQDQPAEALGLLERLRAEAAKQGRTGTLIEIQALTALALADRGDEPGAVGLLTETLALARPQGYVRIFADEGPAMGVLLARLLATQRIPKIEREVPAEYVGRLVAAIEPDIERPAGTSPNRPRSVTATGLVEGLSEREMEVLELLAAGKANREIADELYVTLHTVKKHITHILGKLGAANRTEAAARARELGLLS
jgi:LuxR family transcriptional regulator, maltose regulon positive regulatory protein